MKTVKFYTLGCKANQYDTQQIRERFFEIGLKEAEEKERADVCVINTCTVTQRADSESLNFIRRAGRENPRAKIVVTGCLTELDSGRIKNQGNINLIVKNREKERIARLFRKRNAYGGINDIKATKDGITSFYGHTRAFLKIQDGCDNYCSYCKVPLVRGTSVSKPLVQLIQEARLLAENGFKEIVLTGICLGAYGRDLGSKIRLVDVIEALEKIEGLLRIRLSSIEASDISGDLLQRICESAKLCPHLHIPIQSGDDRILKQMNRRYTRRAYLDLIGKIKRKIPQIAITTDVLVGFPGEDDRSLENTLSLVKKILPLKVHIFPYSPRENTKAAKLQGIPESAITRKRIGVLKEAADRCSLSYRKKFKKRDLPVLIEERVKGSLDTWEGYSDNYIKVRVRSGKDLKNQLVRVKVCKVNPDFVTGEL